MVKDIPYFRLQRSKQLSLRNDILKLEPHENIKRIIITVLEEDSPEYAKVKITLGESEIFIDLQNSFFYGFDHLLTDNSNLGEEKLDCTIQALTSCAISISVNLW